MAETTGAVMERLNETRARIAGDTDGIRGKVFGRSKQTMQGVQRTMSQSIQEPKQLLSRVAANPLGMAIGAMAVGFLAGTLVPKTRLEQDALGEASGQLKQTVDQVGRDAIHRGRELASETIDEVRSALTHEDDDTDVSSSDGQSSNGSAGAQGMGSGDDISSYGGLNPTDGTAQTAGSGASTQQRTGRPATGSQSIEQL